MIINQIIKIEKHKFNMNDEYKFCGYTSGGFILCSDDVEVTILKSNLTYTKFGTIHTKEDFANFLFGLTNVTYFSSIYHNGEKLAYAMYKPVFSSKNTQMTFLISSTKDVFAITFKTTNVIMERKHKSFLEWVKNLSIEYNL